MTRGVHSSTHKYERTFGLFNREGKGIEKIRVKKDYPKYYRIFLILFLLSFGTNVFILTFYLSLNIYHGMGREFSIKQRDRLFLQKDGKRVAVFNILVRDPIPFELEAGS